jgi:hypothetical protein
VTDADFAIVLATFRQFSHPWRDFDMLETTAINAAGS